MRSLLFIMILFSGLACQRSRPLSATDAKINQDNLTFPVEPIEVKPAATTGQLGLNLSGVSYYSSEIVFVDAFKQAQLWTSHAPGKPWGQGGLLELDEKGNLKKLAEGGQYAESLIFHELDGHYPAGEYTCFYDGKGEIEFTHAAKTIKAIPNQIRVEVKPKLGPIALRIRKTDPKDPVRNIRLILPGFAKTYQENPFHPDFLKRLQGFQVIRFMDWGAINGSKVVEWKDRNTPEHLIQSSEKGVAVEYSLQLANRLEVDPWLCVPHLASDDYVRELAKLVKEKLKSPRKLYLEYSNETWNGIFEQGRYCANKGKELKFSDNDFEAQLRYSAHRSVEIFKIAEEVLGKDRLVRVLATQSANPWCGTTTMDWKEAYKSADVIAIAPYFGNSLGDPASVEKVARMKVADILEACQQSLRENKAIIRKYAQEAQKRGLQLMAYEGGQHLVGYAGAENNEALTKLFHDANRHPKMKELYLEDLKNWQESGGGVFCLYASMGRYSKWGSWGLMEFVDQAETTAPKMQAVREFLKMRQ